MAIFDQAGHLLSPYFVVVLVNLIFFNSCLAYTVNWLSSIIIALHFDLLCGYLAKFVGTTQDERVAMQIGNLTPQYLSPVAKHRFEMSSCVAS